MSDASENRYRVSGIGFRRRFLVCVSLALSKESRTSQQCTISTDLFPVILLLSNDSNYKTIIIIYTSRIISHGNGGILSLSGWDASHTKLMNRFGRTFAQGGGLSQTVDLAFLWHLPKGSHKGYQNVSWRKYCVRLTLEGTVYRCLPMPRFRSCDLDRRLSK